MKDKSLEFENKKYETTIFDKKYAKSIDVFGEIESLYKELSYQGTLPIVQCHSINCENLIWASVKWILLKEDGTRILESDKYSVDEVWHKELGGLNLPVNTKLILKAVATNNANTSNVILQYDPSSENIAYFQLNGNTFNINLNFIGTHEEILL